MSVKKFTTMNEPAYTIVGSDGKQYGPVAAAQIRDWLRQTRVDSRTPVFVAGAVDWTFVGLLPEFTTYFPGNPPTITSPKPAVIAPGQTNQLAMWGFILSLVAWFTCCCFPVSLAALAFSIIGLTQVNANNDGQTGRGMAIAGIVISAAHLLWVFGSMLLNGFNQSPEMFWNLPR